MIVIIRANQSELIESPQCPIAAWEMAERLQAETGIVHWVGRI